MKLEIKDNRVTLRLSLQDQAAAAAAASAAKAEKALSNIYTSPATGTEITFNRNKVYHLPASPGTGPITQRPDGAIFGLSQKIYHQDDTIPSLPETWVRMGGSYDTGQLNTIFVEWISPERQEYWIMHDDPAPLVPKDGLTPFIGENGNWHIGDLDTGVRAEAEDGRPVQFQKSATHIQWRYIGDPEWINLVALSELKGEDGYTPQKGIDYNDGEDGLTPTIGGNGNWFIGSTDTGVKAQAEDGRPVQFQKSDTHIQWRYVGDAEWINLVALSELKGEDGYTPQKGIDYNDGENGLTPTIGGNGNWFIGPTDTGVKAQAEDGRPVQFQKSATHIQWRYEGDASWTSLIALADIKGEDGYTPQKGIDYNDGEDGITPHIGLNGNWFIGPTDTGLKAAGEDGKEVEFQKTATHIQWRYVGDTEWTNLVALVDLKGDKGDTGPSAPLIFGPDITANTTVGQAADGTFCEVSGAVTVTVAADVLSGWNMQFKNVGEDTVTFASVGTMADPGINKLMPSRGCVLYYKSGKVQAIGLEA